MVVGAGAGAAVVAGAEVAVGWPAAAVVEGAVAVVALGLAVELVGAAVVLVGAAVVSAAARAARRSRGVGSIRCSVAAAVICEPIAAAAIRPDA